MAISVQQPKNFKNATWRRKIMYKLAACLFNMHDKKFIHYDLHWRNILVTQDIVDPDIFLIDIPHGKIRTYRKKYGVQRDLFCLYKNASQFLSRSDMLRFFLLYKKIGHLAQDDKKQIYKLLRYSQKKLECN